MCNFVHLYTQFFVLYTVYTSAYTFIYLVHILYTPVSRNFIFSFTVLVVSFFFFVCVLLLSIVLFALSALETLLREQSTLLRPSSDGLFLVAFRMKNVLLFLIDKKSCRHPLSLSIIRHQAVTSNSLASWFITDAHTQNTSKEQPVKNEES